MEGKTEKEKVGEVRMIGKFATSKAGHDKDKLYVILARDEKYVYLVDGKYKTAASPKKKSIKHIQIVNQTVDTKLLEQICNKEPYIDDAIKYEIKQKLKCIEVEE